MQIKTGGVPMKNIWIVASMVFILFGGDAQSHGKLSSWMNRADTVALVTVLEGKKVSQAPSDACGFEYKIKQLEVFRGGVVSEIMTNASLVVGGEYLLVVASASSWASREFVTDVPLPPSAYTYPSECINTRPASLLVRKNELRIINKVINYAPPEPPRVRETIRWAQFPPNVMWFDRSVRLVSDMDRLEVNKWNSDWPLLPLHVHVRVEDAIKLLAEDCVASCEGELPIRTP